MTEVWRYIVPLVAAAVVFATGFVLTRSGQPYSVSLLALHKLVDLGAIIFIGWIVVTALQSGALHAVDWALVAAALILAIATLATGGLVSARESAVTWITLVHRWLPWPLALVAAAAVYRIVAG